MREKRMVERGPRKSGREEFGEMRGREGFWIGWEEAARDEISCARELRVSSGRQRQPMPQVNISSIFLSISLLYLFD